MNSTSNQLEKFRLLYPIIFSDYLSIFFSLLKDGAAQNVGYTNILGEITDDEHEKLSRVLSRTAEFTETFDIGNYSTMAEYSLAVNRHNGNGKFNAITNIYDLGDELYYVRYSTDLCFYNGTVLRRTDKATGNYQILNVRNDCIPFSDAQYEDSVRIREVINAYLRKLSRDKRRIFIRRYWYFSPISEIAADFSISEGKVKMILMRARNELRQMLEKAGVSI
jgi:RNA polymerase sigma factor (sigma-70 family)